MACRTIVSPITKLEVRSQLWDSIRNITGDDQIADSIYQQTITDKFHSWFGNNWINDPIVNSSNINKNGEPLLIGFTLTNNIGQTASIYDLDNIDRPNLKDSILTKLKQPLAKQLFNKFYEDNRDSFYNKLSSVGMTDQEISVIRRYDQYSHTFKDLVDWLNNFPSLRPIAPLSKLEEAFKNLDKQVPKTEDITHPGRAESTLADTKLPEWYGYKDISKRLIQYAQYFNINTSDFQDKFNTLSKHWKDYKEYEKSEGFDWKKAHATLYDDIGSYFLNKSGEKIYYDDYGDEENRENSYGKSNQEEVTDHIKDTVNERQSRFSHLKTYQPWELAYKDLQKEILKQVTSSQERINSNTPVDDSNQSNIQSYDYDDKSKTLNFMVQPSILKSLNLKDQSIAVRPNRYPSGVYRYNNEYYNVVQRPGKKLINDYKDSKEIRKGFSREDLTKDYIKDFNDNKLALYTYDITKLQANTKVNPKDYKGEIKEAVLSKQNTYRTGNPTFDKYIEKFYEKHKTLSEQLSNTKDPELQRKYSKEIASINNDIKNLSSDATVQRLTQTAGQQLKKLSNDLDRDNYQMPLKEIYEGLRLTQAWRDIDQVLEFNREYADPDDITTIAQAERIRSKATNLYNRYFEKYLSTVKQEISERLGDKAAEEALKPIKDINNLEKQFIGISFSGNPLEQALDHIIRENNFNVNKEFDEFEEGLTSKLSSTEDKKLSFLLQPEKDGTKSFLTLYNRDFINEAATKHDEAVNGTIEWNKYYDWFKDNFDYELSKEGEDTFNEFAESIKDDYLIRDENGDPVLDKQNDLQYNSKAYSKEVKNISPYEFQKYLDGTNKKSNRGSRWFTITPKDKHINSNYSKLSPQQKELYHYYTDEFTKAQGNIPIDYRFNSYNIDQLLYNFITTTDKSTLEQLKSTSSKVKSYLQDLATVNYTEPEHTNQNINPLTGDLEDSIKFRNLDSFKNDTNSPDMAKILKDFKKFSLMYESKTNSEDRILAIRDMAKTLDKAETTSDGRLKFNTFKDIIATKGKTNIADRVEYNAEAYLYDKRKNPLKAVGSDNVIGERNFSLEKLVDSINNYTRIRQLALAPLSAASNMFVGGVNNFMYAAQSQEFDDKHLLKAYNIMRSTVARFYSSAGGIIKATNFHTDNAEKAAKLIERFNLLGDLTESMYFDDKLSSSVSKLFFMNKGGEFLNQGATMVAMMLKEKINTASGEKSLWDASKLTKDGKLEFDENIEDKHLLEFFNKVLKVNKRIHGDYDIDNPMYAKKGLVGRVFMLFRSWLPQSVYQRVHKEREDYQLGTTKGRWRSYEALYRDKDGKLDFGNAARFILKATIPLATRGVKFKDNISELDRKNLMVNVREMQFVMALTMATLLLKGWIQSPDDDTRKKDPWLLYLYNQTNRFQNELTFFYSFTSFDQFIQDVIPMESTIRQMGKVTSAVSDAIFYPEEDQYKNGFRKGKSKLATQSRMLFPITKQAESVYSTFNNLYQDRIR